MFCRRWLRASKLEEDVFLPALCTETSLQEPEPSQSSRAQSKSFVLGRSSLASLASPESSMASMGSKPAAPPRPAATGVMKVGSDNGAASGAGDPFLAPARATDRTDGCTGQLSSCNVKSASPTSLSLMRLRDCPGLEKPPSLLGNVNPHERRDMFHVGRCAVGCVADGCQKERLHEVDIQRRLPLSLTRCPASTQQPSHSKALTSQS